MDSVGWLAGWWLRTCSHGVQGFRRYGMFCWAAGLVGLGWSAGEVGKAFGVVVSMGGWVCIRFCLVFTPFAGMSPQLLVFSFCLVLVWLFA
jgi:hypothetical protein